MPNVVGLIVVDFVVAVLAPTVATLVEVAVRSVLLALAIYRTSGNSDPVTPHIVTGHKHVSGFTFNFIGLTIVVAIFLDRTNLVSTSYLLHLNPEFWVQAAVYLVGVFTIVSCWALLVIQRLELTHLITLSDDWVAVREKWRSGATSTADSRNARLLIFEINSCPTGHLRMLIQVLGILSLSVPSIIGFGVAS